MLPDIAQAKQNPADLKIAIISLHDAVHHPSFKDGNLKDRVMLEIGRSEQGKGILATIANNHSSSRSVGMIGSHRDDANEARAKQDYIDDFLRRLKEFNDLDNRIAKNIHTLRYFSGIEVDALNDVLSDIKKASENDSKGIRVLEGHKDTFKDYDRNLQNLDTRRRRARQIDDLINIENEIENIAPRLARDLDSSRDARRDIGAPERGRGGPDLDMGPDPGESPEEKRRHLKRLVVEMKGLQDKLLTDGRITRDEGNRLELITRAAWRLGWRPNHEYGPSPSP